MKTKIAELLASKIEGFDTQKVEQLLEVPPKADMGDFAFPCFQLAKVFRKAPNMIAADIAEQIGEQPFLAKVEVKGAYLNFFVDKTIFVRQVMERACQPGYGKSDLGEGKTVCIDYSSPNVAKKFHVGHLRTTIIGNSLYKIFTKLGYQVERINHLGDWGTQFGKLIVAYKKWGSKEAVEENGIAELMNIYVKFHEEAEKDDSLNDEARAWFTKMEQGDQEALEIWQWFKDISLIEYKKTYEMLGIEFDSYAGESFYCDKSKRVIDECNAKNLLEESEGAYIVRLDEYNMAPCIVMKKDGSSIYATRDLAAVLYRKDTYHFDKCIYVTGLEQKLHFAQVFKVIELLGYEWAKEQLVHVPYGLVSLKGGKLSTRKGNIIYAEDILNESVNRIHEIIEEKNPNLPDKADVAHKVGVGAILFNDLYNQRIKDVVFDWDKIHNFDGETGPYVQYTYARAASILRKRNLSEFDMDCCIDCSILTDDASIALLKEINRYPEVIKAAADRLEPSVVARYAMAVAQAFNKFYHDNQCIVEDEEVCNARLKLLSLAKTILRDSLGLLGIECPEQM
jgi:arginyl-tRNA synthetase